MMFRALVIEHIAKSSKAEELYSNVKKSVAEASSAAVQGPSHAIVVSGHFHPAVQMKSDTLTQRAIQKHKRRAEIAEKKLELLQSRNLDEPLDSNEFFKVFIYLLCYLIKECTFKSF